MPRQQIVSEIAEASPQEGNCIGGYSCPLRVWAKLACVGDCQGCERSSHPAPSGTSMPDHKHASSCRFDPRIEDPRTLNARSITGRREGCFPPAFRRSRQSNHEQTWSNLLLLSPVSTESPVRHYYWSFHKIISGLQDVPPSTRCAGHQTFLDLRSPRSCPRSSFLREPNRDFSSPKSPPK